MSQLCPEEDDSDEVEATTALQKGLDQQDGPVEHYVSTVKGTLNDMKSGLDKNTNVENMVAHVTSKYLQKFTREDVKTGGDQEMHNFMEKHANYDVKANLSMMQHSIAKELFNISKVVDDGSFHTVLEGGSPYQLKLVYDIPIVCKISLEGKMPPLHLKVNSLNKKD